MEFKFLKITCKNGCMYIWLLRDSIDWGCDAGWDLNIRLCTVQINGMIIVVNE